MSDALQSFFKQVGKTDLLTREQEVELSKLIEAGNEDARLVALGRRSTTWALKLRQRDDSECRREWKFRGKDTHGASRTAPVSAW